MAERLLFLTGKLAEPGLCRILGTLQGPELSYEVLNIGVSVAALMSAEMIARRLDGPRGADRVIVPDLCAGDLTVDAEGRPKRSLIPITAHKLGPAAQTSVSRSTSSTPPSAVAP
ncbi:MAG: hypothetical protein H0U97_11045 [Gammaproteobacteria bacterium]|nr:hypothetical protein [Gammaproteobacteria bacterium]